MEINIPEDFVGLKAKIDDFVKAVKSKDLVYNFETGKLIQNPELRAKIDSGAFPELKINPLNLKTKSFPIYGSSEDIVRLKEYWFPLMKLYSQHISK